MISSHFERTNLQEGSTVLAALEQRLDFVVIAEKRDKKITRPILKDETQLHIAATLEELIGELSNT